MVTPPEIMIIESTAPIAFTSGFVCLLFI